MNLKIKVCGMRDTSNILEVANLRPDYLGFIFYEKSPRFVGTEFVVPIVDKSIKKVGVFVNHNFDFVMEMAGKHGLDGVQLHGGESPDLCGQLRSAGLEVIKAFAVDADMNFDQTEPFESTTDYFLFDTKTSTYGGAGKTFDWSILDRYTSSKSFFLSGGLHPDNMAQVRSIKNKHLIALDMNSGVETSPGVKDINKLKEAFSVLNQLKKS